MSDFVDTDGTDEVKQPPVAAGERPRPLQIVKTGDAADNYSFTLEEENLDHVLSQVPDGMKV
jgi:hypothetical protein